MYRGLLAVLIAAAFTTAYSESALGGNTMNNETAHSIDHIADYVFTHPDLKPLTRRSLKPAKLNSPLAFYGELKKPILEAYLDRAIVHMSTNSREPEVWSERSMKFLKDTGSKFIHWADLGWSRKYTEADWKLLTDYIDEIHSTDWGGDIIYECGIMEAISRPNIDSTRIPSWLLKTLEETGLQKKRRFGPNGGDFFSYESMFDRNATDWPKHFVGIWDKNPSSEQSAPDITMLETRIYYGYLIAEYIDAGFEGIMFGQTMMTGRRDHNNVALNELCTFARRWAEQRAYRKIVTLTSHVNRPTDYPTGPSKQGKPLFTHITWPTRLSYTDETRCGMWFGPDVKAAGKRQGGAEIIRLLNLPHDLPILLEIDNYGQSSGPNAVCDEGYDEITAYANRTPMQRAAFLSKYYFESRGWKNAEGNARVHLALPGYRCLTRSTSLYILPDGKPSTPVNFYTPFKEQGGEEETIRLLFEKARLPEKT